MIRKAKLTVEKSIGKLDRALSEFLELCKSKQIDTADYQTLKHHADDLIGVGQKGLEILNKRAEETKDE